MGEGPILILTTRLGVRPLGVRGDPLHAVASQLLAVIRSLGAQLQNSLGEEARLVGRSLELSTRRPSDDFIYVVDGEPVIAAWGYEADAAASLTGFALPSVPVPSRLAPVMASAPAVPVRVGLAPWLSAL